MKNVSNFVLFLLSMLTLGGCQIAGDIFKAGIWVGVLIVVAIVGGIIWMVSRASS
ncbi:MAG TPA: hypothetical protein VL754_04070 [Verrucomicrobiae bacterium]|jgi:hypothetical protein|nr:hypothetical protein [Verrucomicrobiae bacterium]